MEKQTHDAYGRRLLATVRLVAERERELRLDKSTGIRLSEPSDSPAELTAANERREAMGAVGRRSVGDCPCGCKRHFNYWWQTKLDAGMPNERMVKYIPGHINETNELATELGFIPLHRLGELPKF